MDKLKILEALEKWGYLTGEQLGLLFGRSKISLASEIHHYLLPENFVRADKVTRQNIYLLTKKGHDIISNKTWKSHAPKYYELQHQNLQVQYFASLTNVSNYKTEYELKQEEPKSKSFPDLIVWTKTNEKLIIEIERTKKQEKFYEKKLMDFRDYFKDEYKLIYVTDKPDIKKYLENYLEKLNIDLITQNTKIEISTK